MNYKKVFKITAVILVSLFSLLIIVAFLSLVNFLPSPQKLAQAFKKEAQDTVPLKKSKLAANSASQTSSSHLNQENVTSASGTVEKNQGQVLSLSEQSDQLRAMLDEDPKDLSVCEHLGSSQALNEGKLNLGINDLFSEQSKKDSIVEPFRYAIKNVFQDESIAPLLREILDMSKMQLNENEKESFLTKVNFYSRAAYATANLYAKKSSFEDVSNRAQHLALVAQIAVMKPQLVNDANLYNFCKDLQTSIAEKKNVDIKEERKEILKLISYAGLTPKDLDFDPESFIKFQVKNNQKGISFSLSSKDSEATSANEP